MGVTVTVKKLKKNTDTGGWELIAPGPKPFQIDADSLRKLASTMAPPEEIAAMLGCSRPTLFRRMHAEPELAMAFRYGRAAGRMMLRNAQIKAAMEDGNPQMLIWLGKQWLRQHDRMALTVDDDAEMEHAAQIEQRFIEEMEDVTAKIIELDAETIQDG